MSRRGAPPELFAIASLLLRYPSASALERDAEVGEAVAALPARLRTPFERFLAHRGSTSSASTWRRSTPAGGAR